jgi:hypothetical protein
LICVIGGIGSAPRRIGSVVDGSGASRICCFVRGVGRVFCVLICFFKLRPQLIVFRLEFFHTLLQLLAGWLALTACGQCKRDS